MRGEKRRNVDKNKTRVRMRRRLKVHYAICEETPALPFLPNAAGNNLRAEGKQEHQMKRPTSELAARDRHTSRVPLVAVSLE